jgi:colicin import membrane protein
VAAVPLALAGAAAGVVWGRKRRQPAQACSVCGTPVTDAGGLCAACRHEAAEARRREATERAAGAKREAERRQQAAEAEERSAEEHARRLALEQEARERQAIEQRAREQADREEYEEAERQRRARIATSAPDPADAAFDPYQVLGIQHGADADAIRAAYDAGKAKYDAEQVSHLSPEVQHHYQAKAAAVERAYLMLTSTA